MKRFTCKFAQDKVIHQRLRGPVQKIQRCQLAQPGVKPASRGKAAAIFVRGAYV